MMVDEPRDLREVNWHLLPDNTDPLGTPIYSCSTDVYIPAHNLTSAREVIIRLTASEPAHRLSPAQVLTHPWLTVV